MSGLSAVYRVNEAVDPETLRRMTSRMRHRGPDGTGFHLQENIGLGSCLLRSTPESVGESPVTSLGSLKMVWDGRIDNRAELLALLPENEILDSIPDPVLFLHLYQLSGDQAVSKTLGDFAFIVVDEKTKTIIAGRDRMGMKPLYYHWNGKSFLAASEAKALFAAGVPAEPDEEIVGSFLSFRNFAPEDRHRTFFKHVKRVPPGSYLKLADGRINVIDYWEPPAGKTLRFKSETEYFELFREVFGEAVKARLRTAGKTAVFLSGGLDSSALACEAGKLLGRDAFRKLQALNLYSSEPECDERLFARAAAQRWNVPLTELFSRKRDPLRDIEGLLRIAEVPMVSGNANDEPMEFLRDQGIKAAMSGDGADQLLDENVFPADLFLHFRWKEMFSKSRDFAGAVGENPGWFLTQSLKEILPWNFRKLLWRMSGHVPSAWTAAALRRTAYDRAVKHPRKFSSILQKSSYESVTEPYFSLKMEADERVHGAFGLELRCPFLDSRLVEFALSLPWELRSDGIRKSILRSSLADIIPSEILNRQGKGDWSAYYDERLLRLCRTVPPHPVADISGQMERFVDLNEAGKLVEKYKAGNRGLRFEIWFLIALDRWLKTFQGELHEGTEKETLHEAGPHAVR